MPPNNSCPGNTGGRGSEQHSSRGCFVGGVGQGECQGEFGVCPCRCRQKRTGGRIRCVPAAADSTQDAEASDSWLVKPALGSTWTQSARFTCCCEYGSIFPSAPLSRVFSDGMPYASTINRLLTTSSMSKFSSYGSHLNSFLEPFSSRLPNMLCCRSRARHDKSFSTPSWVSSIWG